MLRKLRFQDAGPHVRRLHQQILQPAARQNRLLEALVLRILVQPRDKYQCFEQHWIRVAVRVSQPTKCAVLGKHQNDTSRRAKGIDTVALRCERTAQLKLLPNAHVRSH